MQHSHKQDQLFAGQLFTESEITNESNYHQNITKMSYPPTFYQNNQLQDMNYSYQDCKLVESKLLEKSSQSSYASYSQPGDYEFMNEELVYSHVKTKKVPFAYNEDMQAMHFNKMQAEKLAATRFEIGDPKPSKTLEALKAFHDIEDDSEDEGIEDYKMGGYHPVHVGEVLHKRYVTVQKLGWGHFSTVWLCRDFKYDTYVAVKIQKSAEHYIEAAYDEVEILQKVASKVNDQDWIASILKRQSKVSQNDAHVVQLLNSFVYKAPYGNHFCMVFEILGVNLLEIIKRYEFKGVPLNVCKRIAKQTLKGLDFLHRVCGVIHTDLKPENVLLQLSQEEITEIIENGQLSKTQVFNDRLELYHDMFDIPRVSPMLLDSSVSEVIDALQQMTLLTKTQKKNLKKRLSKKRKIEKVLVTDTDSTRTQQEISVQQQKDQPPNYKDLFTLNREKISFKSKGKLPSDFQIKVADLGNACWTHHHFSTLIQTRQYRSPETIIGATYNQTADIWSFACMLFELLTGDFLFEPRKGAHFSKNDDHLAQIQELVGRFPLKYSQSCAKAKRYFSKDGSLKRIPIMNCWSLQNVLIEKYRYKLDEAKQLASFFQGMLNPLPEKRAKAADQLQHSWLQVHGDDSYTGKMDEQDVKNWHNEKDAMIHNGQYLPHPRDKLIESEEDDGDASVAGSPLKRTGNWRNFRSLKHRPKQLIAPRVADMATIDRSFTDLGYIGFETGIDTHQLDQASNQQFID